MSKIEKRNIEYLWKDRKRLLGMPLSFTKYRLSKDRLFIETGALNVNQDEIQLYRVRDISMKKSLLQRIFGVGTVTISSSDKTTPEIILKNVKSPFEIKELINEQVEKVKVQRNVRIGE
ncbi:MAG: PH domain-containing protein, partial [Clostridia bacterium]|nr:PH domain-containing protein [Clostridia bacterium]